MTNASLPLQPAVERYQIHLAVCRYRAAGLACSTCSETSERAERAIRANAPVSEAA
jgi:hypothetical protein